MVTNQIDFEVLEQKTSSEFVKKIKNVVEQVNTSDVWADNEKEIRFSVKEDQYTITVLMCLVGSLQKFEYRFSTKQIEFDTMSWSDIRKFFDIPFGMKKLTKAE